MSKHLLSSTPGPASYNAPSSFVTKNRGFSMPGKPRDFLKLKITEGPGPGSHVHEIPISNGPKYSMPGKIRGRHAEDDVPGPGKYNAVATTLGKTPKYSFAGKAKDFSRKIADEVPGPGKYEPLAAFEKKVKHGPSYSLQGKTKIREKANDAPGPGGYNTLDAYKLGGKGSTKYSIQGKPKDFAKIKIVEGPGPGSHVAEMKNSGPKYSIAAKTREFDSTYIDSTNVATLGMRAPTIVAAPSERRVTVAEMTQLQQRVRAMSAGRSRKDIVPVVEVKLN